MRKVWSGLAMACAATLAFVPPALAANAPALDTGDTAWVRISTALVFLMTPGGIHLWRHGPQ